MHRGLPDLGVSSEISDPRRLEVPTERNDDPPDLRRYGGDSLTDTTVRGPYVMEKTRVWTLHRSDSGKP